MKPYQPLFWKNMRISYSALDSFLTCPAKYKFSEIDKIKAPKSKEAIFGTLIHETLRLVHDPKKLTPATEEEMLKYFTASWNKDTYSSQSEEAVAFEQGVKILKDYYAKNYPANFHIIDLESFFEAGIEDGGETHFVTGKIDRIDKLEDGSLEVIDYKTSRGLPSQKKVDENLQLDVYYLGIASRWPSLVSRPIKLSLYFLRHGEKLSTIKNNEKAIAAKNRILEIIDKIKKSDFAPDLNPLCDWCDFQSVCPYFSHKFNQLAGGELIDGEKIKSIVDGFLEIKEKIKKDEARLSHLAEAINQYCDRYKLERVFGDAGYISRLWQERASYDDKKVAEALKAIGKLEEFLTVDLKKLSKKISGFTREEKKRIDEARVKKKFKVLSAKRN